MARKTFSKELKARVALEALRGEKTVAQLSSEYGVHATQINAWRKQALEGLPELFERGNGADAKAQEAEKEQLYQQDGQASGGGRVAEKKVQAVGLDLSAKRALVEPGVDVPSIRRQCELIGLNRASWYAKERPAWESEENLALMRRIDELYTAHPFYGSRQMTAVLRREGRAVNRKRVRRLMRLMGLQSLAPRPDTSRAHPAHPVYPYLLRDIVVERSNQVWATDITYIRIERGFAYLVAVMDWHSRRVLAWRLSNSLDTEFCVEALQEALRSFGTPEIFNTDQGCQFTSRDFTGVLQAHGIQISMDGKGRAFDNIFVERLWRSVKYEEVYLKHYETMREAREGLAAYFRFYNTERPHQALGYRTPAEVYEAAGVPTPAAA